MKCPDAPAAGLGWVNLSRLLLLIRGHVIDFDFIAVASGGEEQQRQNQKPPGGFRAIFKQDNSIGHNIKH